MNSLARDWSPINCCSYIFQTTFFQAPSTLRRRNLKTEVSLWKRIKCFPSTLRQRNLKMEVLLWKHIKCFPSPLHRRNLKMEVSLWKHVDTRLKEFTEKCSKTGHFGFVFEESSDREATWFRDAIVFKMFSVHTKTQSWRFQIPRVWRAFLKSSVFVTD